MNPLPPASQPAPRTALFAFERVTVEHDGVRILRDLDAAVEEPGITVVAGPSGAGKSTLLRLCNRLEVPSSGRVLFRGRDLTAMDPLRLRRRVGMVFQTPALFAGTVRDNLAVALPGADESRYAEALRAAALDPGMLDRPAGSLSGGEAQRACLARTLVTDPDVLLLDEPTAALDAGPRLAFEQLAIRLAAAGIPMLWVTHDLGQLRRVADRVIAVVAGEVVYGGEPAGLQDVAALQGFLASGGA